MKTAVREGAQKAAYAVMGAPVVAGRKIAEYGGKFGKSAQLEFETWVAEGEKVTGRLMDHKVVSDLKERVDLDQLQGRVEKLRDQLEDVLASWRDTFKPETEEDETDEQAEKAEPEPNGTTADKAGAEAKAATSTAAKATKKSE